MLSLCLELWAATSRQSIQMYASLVLAPSPNASASAIRFKICVFRWVDRLHTNHMVSSSTGQLFLFASSIQLNTATWSTQSDALQRAANMSRFVFSEVFLKSFLFLDILKTLPQPSPCTSCNNSVHKGADAPLIIWGRGGASFFQKHAPIGFMTHDHTNALARHPFTTQLGWRPPDR